MSYVTCQNCGQANADVARVCRYCGTQLQHKRGAYADPAPPTSYVPPHSWQSGALSQHQSAPPAPAPLLSADNFRCPYCQTTQPPVVATRISTAGWVVFGVMIIACFPLFFIGLLIKEEYRQCSWCRASLS
ncbi:MAG TPA: zinc ribbon domain-containing protein [Pyrinomonadaceae bacterium]|nr:zinc ribbon domain-containing protein [Pyrinomonadaceae bacterium]